MNDALRPETLGEILDRTAHIYRSRFLVFLGIATMPLCVVVACLVAMFLLFAWLGIRGGSASPEMVGLMAVLVFAVGSVVFLPICVGAIGLGAGALNHAAAAAFDDRNMTILGAYKAAWKHGWRYIGLLVLEGLILFVAPVVLWTGFVWMFAMGQFVSGKPSPDAGAVMGILMLLFLAVMGIYAVFMLLLLCLSFPVCVVEDVGPGTALKRAVSLSKGTRGRIFVLYLLGWILRWTISFALVIPVILIVSLIPSLRGPQYAGTIGSIMVFAVYGSGFLVRAATQPIYTIAQMLFYYDQRIRKEGFDIEWMMRKAGMVAAPAPVPPAPLWMPPTVVPVVPLESSVAVHSGPTEAQAAPSRDLPEPTLEPVSASVPPDVLPAPGEPE